MTDDEIDQLVRDHVAGRGPAPAFLRALVAPRPRPEATTTMPGARPASRKLHLRKVDLAVVGGPDAGRRLTFEHEVVRIGAGPGNHVVLTDDTVSGRHAEITRTPIGPLLRDLGSTNGTFVDQIRAKEVFLGEERTFRVGATEIRFTLRDEVIDVRPSRQTQFEGLVGQSVQMRQLFSILQRVAPTDLTVLVTGETGTGKELVSRALHRRSARRRGPLIVFDCGAVPANLIEGELFGHVRGAFTGASSSRKGAFEQAQGGTLFLDEIGELPLPLQATLLRVLEQREVRRIGGNQRHPVDVRVVAATNRNLRERVEQGSFREDLYYRLAVVEIEVSPLRDRLEDLPALVAHLLQTAALDHSVRGLSPEVARRFVGHGWPGNVRELRNTLLRAIPFCEGDLIDRQALPELFAAAPDPEPSDLPLREARQRCLEAFERRYVEALLDRCDGNISRAARAAGVDRKTLSGMMRRLGFVR